MYLKPNVLKFAGICVSKIYIIILVIKFIKNTSFFINEGHSCR